MSARPHDRPHERPRGADPTAAPAALGLGLLAVGGWLLTTARPWHKPGHPLALGLGWSVSALLLLGGLALLTRCVRAVHRADPPPAPADAPPYDRTGPAGDPPPRPVA
ncbi:hypothetical protein AB0P12_20180 [Streptomyces subrutilus]|uniref:Uncharacterized protein n=1 Tax=Streptomyces subrutilus TaxID=36818 RepID=A0A5P2UP25_9ACTN|nr:hypothetical protein [Streptomyces subrutilus]QEU79371.1 hypothetical protein CP968_14525 [Streptomyces subrutilus]WSJ31432.1 hypothetical protein OG479_20315 [Streptomyces subrutilus]GGZ54082.1 hypothetical protein GCM10010371_12060 [Streptomyces subrutilus]